MNSSRSRSVSLAIELFQVAEFRCQVEQGKIVCEQVPVEGCAMEGGVFNQQVNITPIPAMTGRIVNRSLNFEANEIVANASDASA